MGPAVEGTKSHSLLSFPGGSPTRQKKTTSSRKPDETVYSCTVAIGGSCRIQRLIKSDIFPRVERIGDDRIPY